MSGVEREAGAVGHTPGNVKRFTATIGYNSTTNGESYPVTRECVGASDYDTLSAAIDAAIRERDEAYARVAWQPIETAPEAKGDYFFCLVACGPEGDQSTGYAIRWNGRWFASGVFHVIGADRRFEIRETEVSPTHWMPLPLAPELAKEPS